MSTSDIRGDERITRVLLDDGSGQWRALLDRARWIASSVVVVSTPAADGSRELVDAAVRLGLPVEVVPSRRHDLGIRDALHVAAEHSAVYVAIGDRHAPGSHWLRRCLQGAAEFAASALPGVAVHLVRDGEPARGPVAHVCEEDGGSGYATLFAVGYASAVSSPVSIVRVSAGPVPATRRDEHALAEAEALLGTQGLEKTERSA